MRTLLMFFTLCLLMASCRNDDMAPIICGVRDPLNELSWLKTRMEETNRQRDRTVPVTAISHNNQNYIEFHSLDLLCYRRIHLCDGQRLDN